MKIEQVWVTPELAKSMLEKNKENRHINVATVVMYATDMKKGNWKFTHQSLLLGHGENVIDGQHRLHAVIKSGIPQHFIIATDDSVMTAKHLPIDQGLKRSCTFITGKNKSLIATANLAINFSQNTMKISAIETSEWADFLDYPHSQVLRMNKSTRRGVSCAPMWLAGTVRVLLGDDPDWIHKTYISMVSDKFQELDPLPSSFYKQMVIDRIAMNPREYFARAIRVLDQSRKNFTKIQIKNESFAFNEARETLISVCSKKLIA